MADRLPLPLSLSELEDIRLSARRRLETTGTGSIIRRRMGQSLEYREHRRYVQGDDPRHIDWRASARLGRPNHYLVRAYEAEEQFNLLIAVDLRDTMRLPAPVTKLQFALWVLEALAHISRQQKIKVAFTPLYASTDRWRGFSQGGGIRGAVERALDEFWRPEAPNQGEALNAAAAAKALPQASATILITDLYAQDAPSLISWAGHACRGYRQVILCELDTWPAERRLLEGQMVRLADVGVTSAPIGEFEPDAAQLDEAAARIDQCRTDFGRHIARMRGIVTRWTSPEILTQETAAVAFRQWFRIFIRDSELFARRT